MVGIVPAGGRVTIAADSTGERTGKLTSVKRVMISVLVVLCLATACVSETDTAPLQEDAATPSPVEATPDVGPDGDSVDPDDEGRAAPDPAAPKPEPVPYVPAGQPGSAQDYADMIERLEPLIPAELRSQAPWPDLRNSNPIVAQIEIFELWIWMAEFLTDPQLVEVMAAPGSPSRQDVVAIFGELQAENVFERRSGEPYQAFNHLVVTFESAGLPLWLGRGVPDGAVVVYYSDSSGPVEIIDQDTDQILGLNSGIGTRTWLSIMVPTDVGWQLWRDQLIDPSNPELQVPDVPPPGASEQPRSPEV